MKTELWASLSGEELRALEQLAAHTGQSIEEVAAGSLDQGLSRMLSGMMSRHRSSTVVSFCRSKRMKSREQ